MTDVILVLDSSGRYLKVAPSGAAFLSRPPDQLLGRTLHDVLPDFTATLFLNYIREALDTGRPVHAEYRVKLEDYDRWFSATISPMLEDSVVWVARDITAQRQLQEQLQQAVKMEAVGRLAGGIAHDFNNLLTAILGTSAVLLEELEEHSIHREDVSEIQRAAERASTLTRQLLAFSRRQVLQPRVIDLNTVVRMIDRMLFRLLGEDIQRQIVLAQDLGRVRADPGQIEQVIVNLAVNARDAMPGGGILAIETANVELAERDLPDFPVVPGRYIRLGIRDTGHGMTPETRAHLFEPFFTTKSHGKGTGLGLATVYGIVKQSGGYIQVESSPGAGAEFRLFLPRVEAALDEPVPDGGPPADAQPEGVTILLVEDEEPVRRMARRVLERNGYTVIDAASGEEGLRIAIDHDGELHLVLADVVMPGISGPDLIQRLQRYRSDFAVIYSSGYTDEMVARHGLHDSGTAFLQKPFTPEHLINRVRQVLSTRESS